MDNLKFIRQQNLNFMFGIENNRVVSEARWQYIQIQKFEGWSSDDSAMLYLKDYGMVKVFRQICMLIKYDSNYRNQVMGIMI